MSLKGCKLRWKTLQKSYTFCMYFYCPKVFWPKILKINPGIWSLSAPEKDVGQDKGVKRGSRTIFRRTIWKKYENFK